MGFQDLLDLLEISRIYLFQVNTPPSPEKIMTMGFKDDL